MTLRADEVKELVLHDSAAERTAIGAGVLLLEGRLSVTLHRAVLPVHALIVEVSVGRAEGLVRTLLGDGVDAAAREAALTDVVGSHHDLDFLDSVHRDGVRVGLAAVRTAGGKAEHVVGHGTVYLEAVIPVVCPGNCDAAYLRGDGHRRVLHYIIHVTVDGRRRTDVVQAEILRAASPLPCTGHDGGLAQLGVCRHHLGVERQRVAQFEEQLLEGFLSVTQVGDGHRVGAAGAQALERVASVVVGHGRIA